MVIIAKTKSFITQRQNLQDNQNNEGVTMVTHGANERPLTHYLHKVTACLYWMSTIRNKTDNIQEIVSCSVSKD
jgi:hypothetical protein